MASGQTGFFEIVNTAINTPYTNAANYDMVLRTDQRQQKLLIGNGSNTTPAITLSNNFVGINTTPSFPLHVNGGIGYQTYAFSFSTANSATVGSTNSSGGAIPYTVADSNLPITTISNSGVRVPVKGIYMFTVIMGLVSTASGTFRCGINRSAAGTSSVTFNSISNNSEFIALFSQEQYNSQVMSVTCNVVAYCNANDYVRVFAMNGPTSTVTTYSWGPTTNVFSGYLISQL